MIYFRKAKLLQHFIFVKIQEICNIKMWFSNSKRQFSSWRFFLVLIEIVLGYNYKTKFIMKTRLLFFMFMICSFANAQATFNTPYASSVEATTANLNVFMSLNNTYLVSYQIATTSAGVDSATNLDSQNTFAGTYNHVRNITGLLPNTTYYFRFRAYAFGVYTNSAIGSFTTLPLTPIISNVSSTGISYNGATINYTLNAQGFNTASVIKYGLSAATMTNQVTGISATGSANTNANIALTGLSNNTQYYYVVEAVNANGTTTSQPVGTFTTTNVYPLISYISTSSSATQTSITINYLLNANGSNTTSVVQTFAGGIVQLEETGVSATGTNNVPGSVTLTGLTPNTTYELGINATNSYGSTFVGFFYFTTHPLPQTIAEYTFDNTLNNINSNSPFSSSAGITYTADRNGNPNSALRIANGAETTATIANLPYERLPRTISFWAKTETMSTRNLIFNYGVYNAANPNNWSAFYYGATNAVFVNGSNTVTTTNNNSTWYHYVCTYDGKQSRIYKDGVLISTSMNFIMNTLNSSDVFKLGITGSSIYGFDGAIDDLKIYNYALTQADVTSLYTTNTLSSQDFIQNNLKVGLYPNPVDDVLNIESDTELKSVEIYNMQGREIQVSNQKQINVSDLASGIYMVRIQDKENGIVTKKIIKQ